MMRAVKVRILALVLVVTALLSVYGCGSILDGDTLSITDHIEPSATSADGVLEAATYDQLKYCILSFIRNHDKDGLIRVYSYDGDVQSDVDLACTEIPKDDPLGAYAVSEMVGTVKQIVSRYDIEVYIAYKDVTQEQLDGIITVSNARDLDYRLEFILGDYVPYLTALMYGFDLAEEDALDSVSRIYYDNPRDIVMLPVTTVDFYPKYGNDRIIEFTFGYRYEPSTLAAMEQSLKDSVRDIADSVLGEDAMQVLMLLAQRVMETTEYDEETSAGVDYSNQNISATAYSALINGKAVSEGYAMAYKALCDELGIECTVVIGKYDGALYAWNIVGLEDNYYHIDVSNCDLSGLDAAFLKNDDYMKTDYTWDTDAYNVCDGPLSYDTLAVETLTTEASIPEDATTEASTTETSMDELPATTEPEVTPAD